MLNQSYMVNEMENQDLEDQIDDLETETSDLEDQIDDEVELTVDDYNKLKREHEKATKKLVELKKQLKTQTKETPMLTEEKLALREEVSEFLLDNKDYKEYKTDLLKYREQGFSIKQAIALIEADDKTIENRKKLQSMNITSWEPSTKKDTYTQSEIAKMPLEQRAKIYEWVKSWKYKVTA